MTISWLPFTIFPEIIPLSVNNLTTWVDCFEKKESSDSETICQVHRFAFWSQLLEMQRLWIPVDLRQDKISTRVAVCQQATTVQINNSHDLNWVLHQKMCQKRYWGTMRSVCNLSAIKFCILRQTLMLTTTILQTWLHIYNAVQLSCNCEFATIL